MNLEDFINGTYISALGNQYFGLMPISDGPECLRLWNIIRDIMRDLEYIHSLQEVHRDLKPQNGTSTPSVSKNSASFH